jgi:hypothetical protein
MIISFQYLIFLKTPIFIFNHSSVGKYILRGAEAKLNVRNCSALHSHQTKLDKWQQYGLQNHASTISASSRFEVLNRQTDRHMPRSIAF